MSTASESGGSLAAVPVDDSGEGRDVLFERLAAEFAAPLVRLVRAHEADISLQQDLLQEIHVAIWRSLPSFAGLCSLRTWVYRVAHNVAATHVLRRRRVPKDLLGLDDIDIASESLDPDSLVDNARVLERMRALMQRLKPLDREVFVLYLEGLPVEDIAEIAGLSQTNTGTKLHRIRTLLTAQLRAGVGS